MKATLLILTFLNIFSQQNVQDPEAKKVLELLSKNARNEAGLKINFTLITENHQDNTTQKVKGELWLKGDKYKLALDKTITYYDGKNVYTYIPKAKEVTITKPSEKDDELFIRNPSKIFTLYQKNFKFRYLGQTTYNRNNCHEVDLYPVDINKSYSIIKLLIKEDEYALVAAKMIMKAGIHYIFYVDKFDNAVRIDDREFTFDTKANKDVEVVDLRK
ncbi:MAG: outer membrane lipoprotein carrier protein LolA [Bacteroidales bacterium]|nr:outer membrane lipoprotein carrier protein LolA [Bacteroidales bacterium]